MTTYIDTIHASIGEEIEILQRQIIDREDQIETLRKANEAATNRVKGLMSAKTKLDEALNELRTIPGWESGNKPIISKSDLKPGRTPTKKLAMDIVRQSNGLTVAEIMRTAEARNITFKETSVRAFLAHSINDGTIIRRDGKYYINQANSAAA